jgi:hypothetical protein
LPRRATQTASAAERTARSRWIGLLGRVGLAAQGASFTIVAVLALALALDEGGKATDPQGAFVTVAKHAWGRWLLVMLAAGLAGYAVWRFAEAFFDRARAGAGLRGRAERAVKFVQGGVYAALAVAAVRIVLGAKPSSGRSAKSATADVLSWPGGEFLVAAAGIAIIAVGVANAYWGIAARFKEGLRTDELSRREERFITGLGTAGFLSLTVVFGIVGWFLLQAARDHRSDETVTLGGALSKIAHAAYGPWLLALTAIGLLAFGLFAFVQARYHRV